MRIGFYTPNYPGLNSEGGIGTYTQTLGRGLAGCGHEVHVLTQGLCPPAADGPVNVRFVSTRHLPLVDRVFPGAGACWRVARELRRLSHEQKLDVIEIANWEGYGLLHLKTARLPTVVRLYTSSKEAQEIDGGAAKRFERWDVHRERWQARMTDLLVTHSAAHRRRMVDEIGIPADRIRLVPLGVPVDPAFVRPPRSPGPPTVVYLGRLEHRKGTVALLQAVPKVLERVPDAKFVLIGADRPHAPGGRTHADYLAQDFPATVRQAVTLAGRLPDAEVDRRLQTADLFVAPSRYESFGLIFAEAMRWGTPVIGTTAGGIPEVVEHEKSGWLVPPESPDELAAAIVRLLSNPDLRATLGAAGRRRAEAEFSTATMVRRMEAVYAEAIARKRGAR
jgi:glycosyltransferase involved in cell wall biosynthesis